MYVLWKLCLVKIDSGQPNNTKSSHGYAVGSGRPTNTKAFDGYFVQTSGDGLSGTRKGVLLSAVVW